MKTREAIVFLAAVTVLCAGIGCEAQKKGGDSAGAAKTAAESPSTPGRGGRGFPERAFDADPALLGLSYADSTVRLRFSPPRGWPPLEPELFAATLAALERAQPKDLRFVSRPVRMFYDKDKRMFMILSVFPNWPAPVDPLVALAEYRDLVHFRIPHLDMEDSFYRHGPLDFYELVLTNPVMINTRVMILYGDRPPIQVDYLVPRVAHDLVAKAIEASIGSFQPF